MATWTLRARGSATPSDVWGRYVDTRRWSQWSPQIRDVRTDGGPLITPGLTGTVRAVGGPAVHFQVDAVDADAMMWSWTVRLGPLRLRLVHGVEAGTSTASTASTWLRVTGPLPVVAVYTPLAQFALSRLVRN